MTSPSAASTAAPSTRWGDRRQRRIDILDAARARIVAGGYGSLNMRDVAAAAGISPATLYSYFGTKEQLFATLYAQAIRAHTDAYRPVAAAGHHLAPLLVLVIERHVDLYRTYGRYFTLWSTLRRDPAAQAGEFPTDLVDELRAATREHNRLLMDSIHAAAARDGRHVADDRMVPSFLWSALTGLADHVTSERRALDGYPASHLVEFAAARLALAITDPAQR